MSSSSAKFSSRSGDGEITLGSVEVVRRLHVDAQTNLAVLATQGVLSPASAEVAREVMDLDRIEIIESMPQTD